MRPCILGLGWEWTRRELYVFNRTKHVIQVDLGDSTPICGVDIGKWSVFPITMKTRMVTLSHYTDTHDLMSVFVWDSGSWTTNLTPMVPPSCYTNDRRTGACTLEKHARMRAGSELFVD
jgi:hypothetical protein